MVDTPDGTRPGVQTGRRSRNGGHDRDRSPFPAKVRTLECLTRAPTDGRSGLPWVRSRARTPGTPLSSLGKSHGHATRRPRTPLRSDSMGLREDMVSTDGLNPCWRGSENLGAAADRFRPRRQDPAVAKAAGATRPTSTPRQAKGPSRRSSPSLSSSRGPSAGTTPRSRRRS